MATERNWSLLTSSDNCLNFETAEAQDNTYTYSLQKVGKLLYFMKESLVTELGWSVVSCSYRDDTNSYHAANTTTYTAGTSDGWTTGSTEFATGSIVAGQTATTSSYYHASSSGGRSWILLKHSGSFTPALQENSGDFYHILLDYSSTVVNINPAGTNTVVSSTQRENAFGNSFNIIIFPKAPSNPLGTPSENLRPHDPAEIYFNSTTLFQATDHTTNVGDRLYVLKDEDTRGFIFLITGGGEFRGFFAMDTYSDHYSSQAGKVFNLLYSQVGNSKTKLNSYSTLQTRLLTRGTSASMPMAGSTTCLRGVSSYSAGSYTVSPFISCIPSFVTSAFTYWMYLAANKKTLDNTYVEWPLPVLDIQNVSTGTYYFKGRLPDIKMGPSSGADGVMSKPNNLADYDRVLLSGLWFPWASDTAIEF